MKAFFRSIKDTILKFRYNKKLLTRKLVDSVEDNKSRLYYSIYAISVFGLLIGGKNGIYYYHKNQLEATRSQIIEYLLNYFHSSEKLFEENENNSHSLESVIGNYVVKEKKYQTLENVILKEIKANKDNLKVQFEKYLEKINIESLKLSNTQTYSEIINSVLESKFNSVLNLLSSPKKDDGLNTNLIITNANLFKSNDFESIVVRNFLFNRVIITNYNIKNLINEKQRIFFTIFKISQLLTSETIINKQTIILKEYFTSIINEVANKNPELIYDVINYYNHYNNNYKWYYFNFKGVTGYDKIKHCCENIASKYEELTLNNLIFHFCLSTILSSLILKSLLKDDENNSVLDFVDKIKSFDTKTPLNIDNIINEELKFNLETKLKCVEFYDRTINTVFDKI